MAEAAVIAGLGWVACPVITKLVNKSSSYLGSNITKELEDLETILQPQIQRTIEAAEHSPSRAQFSGWLARLKNAYLDAEPILHDLEYERLKRKAQGEGKKRLVCLSSKPIIKPIVKKASLLSAQKRKLLKRLKKLKEVAAEAKILRGLLSTESTQSTQNAGDNPFVTTSLPGNADKVFGRNGEYEEIIKFLLDEQGGCSSSTKSYSVIAVTGMGGAGKTTLAQYVYNDERVKKYFGVRMWLSLSQNMDIIEHIKEMIEFASGKPHNLNNLSKLQEELVETLPENIKVMVVLDNVWYDNNDGAVRENQWENLLKPFHSRGGTCKIMVTSRSSWSFPIDLQPEKLIQLSDLAPDDFKSLLRYRAIDGLLINNPQK
ncbi:putative disease resistance protein At3g14460 isoform X2 [Carex rostrata]